MANDPKGKHPETGITVGDGQPPLEGFSASVGSSVDSGNARPAGKPGRHKGDCTCERCEAKRSGTPFVKQSSSNKSPSNAPFDKNACAAGIASVVDFVDSIACESIINDCDTIFGPDNVKARQSYVAKVHIGDAKKALICQNGSALLERHPALATYLPEVFTSLGILSWGAGILFTKLELGRLRKTKMKLEKEQNERDKERQRTQRDEKVASTVETVRDGGATERVGSE